MSAVWIIWLLIVADRDFRLRRIPNWLVAGGAGLSILALLIRQQPFGVNGSAAVAGGLLAFGFMLIFYVLKVMGAGDVKLAGAIGLWVGITPLFPIWIGASLLAGLHALFFLVLRRWPVFPRLAMALAGAEREENSNRVRKRPVPYGAYLAISGIIWTLVR